MKRRMLLFLSVLLNVILISGFVILIQKLGGIKYLVYRFRHDGITGVYEHRKNILEKMPETSGAIVFLGDSHTAYQEWAEVFQNPVIKNRGIAGDGTEGVLKRLPTILENRPSKIFLMIGVNDLLFLSPDQILENYRLIVETINKNSPQTKLYLQSILPVNPNVRFLPLSNRDIERLNLGIEVLAKKNKAEFVNLYPRFLDSSGLLKSELTQDGIHLDQPGYEIWIAAIRDLVNS